jgi:hypothetical protein
VPCCTRYLLHHGVRDALEMMTSTGLSELNMMQLRTLVLFDYDKIVHQFDDEVRPFSCKSTRFKSTLPAILGANV